jgi:hypothetical protein
VVSWEIAGEVRTSQYKRAKYHWDNNQTKDFVDPWDSEEDLSSNKITNEGTSSDREIRHMIPSYTIALREIRMSQKSYYACFHLVIHQQPPIRRTIKLV